MKKTSILIFPTILCLALVSCNQEKPVEETASTTANEAVKAESTGPEVSAPEAGGTIETCSTLGQYFAISTNLHELEFSAEEKEAIVEGFRQGLEGGHGPDFMQEKVSVISSFLQERHQAKAAVESEVNKKAAAEFIEELKTQENVKFSDSGLGYEILEQGEGEPASLTDAVSVNYRGTLIDGTVFDESMDPENPVTFPLGGVIPGFSEGLQLVSKGGKIRLYIPSELGYGDNPRPGGPIKAGSLLVFEVTIQDIQRPELPSAEGLTPPPPPPLPTEEAPTE